MPYPSTSLPMNCKNLRAKVIPVIRWKRVVCCQGSCPYGRALYLISSPFNLSKVTKRSSRCESLIYQKQYENVILSVFTRDPGGCPTRTQRKLCTLFYVRIMANY